MQSILVTGGAGFIGSHTCLNLIKKGYEVIKVRKTVNSIGFFGSAFFLYLISFEDSLLNAVILLCLINICSGICAGGFGVNHADLGPKYTGSLVGIAGSIGMIAAILAPIVAGFILEITNSWSSIFYICSFVLIFGGIFYLIFALRIMLSNLFTCQLLELRRPEIVCMQTVNLMENL